MISSELSIHLHQEKFPNFDAECHAFSHDPGRHWMSLKVHGQEVTVFGLTPNLLGEFLAAVTVAIKPYLPKSHAEERMERDEATQPEHAYAELGAK